MLLVGERRDPIAATTRCIRERSLIARAIFALSVARSKRAVVGNGRWRSLRCGAPCCSSALRAPQLIGREIDERVPCEI
jgi:hypothetical protein